MKNIALTSPDQIAARDRAAEIAAILAAAIVRSQCPTDVADTDVGLGFLPGQSVHTTPSQQES